MSQLYILIATDNEGKVHEIVALSDFDKALALRKVFIDSYGARFVCFSGRNIDDIPENWKLPLYFPITDITTHEYE